MTSPLKLEKYDIILCGGGQAGCVLAARLTEDPNLIVLMLEAGENANEDPLISTPGLFAQNYDNPDRDWAYMGEPCPELNNREIGIPRGKCIGGSSAINLMALIYPSSASLDGWASLGNSGWDWKNMAPYYRKFQRNISPTKELMKSLSIDFIDPEIQGKDGPIATSYPGTAEPLQKAWVETWKGLKKHIKGDPLLGTCTGGYTSTATIDSEKGERSHAGVDYYAPAAHRSNLHVVTGAMIDKVTLDTSISSAVRATGVTFTHSGQQYTAVAKREVILTAGVIGSPSILERSGIGSKSLCEELGIESVVNNPNVGENLQDHLAAGPSYEVNDGVETVDMMRDPAVVKKAMEQYQISRTGPLAGGGGHAFAYTPLVDFITPLPENELRDLLDKHLTTPSTTPPYKSQKQHEAFIRSIIESPKEASATLSMINVQFNGHLKYSKDKLAIQEDGNYITLLAQLSHPFSRGSVHIKSRDANAHPKIDQQFCSHPLDVEIIARHLLQCETLVASPPLCTFLKPNGRRLPPGKDASTLENAKDLARSAATSNLHPCGTCAMMPADLGGVVDSRLKVHGTSNLRVVDASIFPIIPRGNIQSTVYAIAEKAADIIKQDLKSG